MDNDIKNIIIIPPVYIFVVNTEVIGNNSDVDEERTILQESFLT